MCVRVVTPEHTEATYTPARAHADALHVQAYATPEFDIVIDLCHFSSYHISVIATLLITSALTY